MLQFQRAGVDVDTGGEFTGGQTLIDRRHGVKTGANAWAALHVDEDTLLPVPVGDLKRLIRAAK